MAKYNFLKLYIVKIGKNYQTFKNNKNYTSFYYFYYFAYFASPMKQSFLKKYIK